MWELRQSAWAEWGPGQARKLVPEPPWQPSPPSVGEDLVKGLMWMRRRGFPCSNTHTEGLQRRTPLALILPGSLLCR